MYTLTLYFANFGLCFASSIIVNCLPHCYVLHKFKCTSPYMKIYITVNTKCFRPLLDNFQTNDSLQWRPRPENDQSLF